MFYSHKLFIYNEGPFHHNEKCIKKCTSKLFFFSREKFSSSVTKKLNIHTRTKQRYDFKSTFILMSVLQNITKRF